MPRRFRAHRRTTGRQIIPQCSRAPNFVRIVTPWLLARLLLASLSQAALAVQESLQLEMHQVPEKLEQSQLLSHLILKREERCSIYLPCPDVADHQLTFYLPSSTCYVPAARGATYHLTSLLGKPYSTIFDACAIPGHLVSPAYSSAEGPTRTGWEECTTECGDDPLAACSPWPYHLRGSPPPTRLGSAASLQAHRDRARG